MAKQELLINDQIRLNNVQVISETGEKLGVMSSRAALDLASQRDLDLVFSCSKWKSTSL